MKKLFTKMSNYLSSISWVSESREYNKKLKAFCDCYQKLTAKQKRSYVYMIYWKDSKHPIPIIAYARLKNHGWLECSFDENKTKNYTWSSQAHEVSKLYKEMISY